MPMNCIVLVKIKMQMNKSYQSPYHDGIRELTSLATYQSGASDWFSLGKTTSYLHKIRTINSPRIKSPLLHQASAQVKALA